MAPTTIDGNLPNRPPEREYRFPLDGPHPSPEEFVNIMEAEGFEFDRTTRPIRLREPKEAVYEDDHVVFRQWDIPNG